MSKKMNKRAQSKMKLNQLKKTLREREGRSSNREKLKKTLNVLRIFWAMFIPAYLYLIYRLFELDNYLF